MSQRRCRTCLPRGKIRWSDAGADTPWQHVLDGLLTTPRRRIIRHRHHDLRGGLLAIFTYVRPQKPAPSRSTTIDSNAKSP